MGESFRLQTLVQLSWLLLLCLLLQNAAARDLAVIRKDGVLRHLGIPYANFVTGYGDGLDVELIQGFAAHLNLRYEYIETDWKRVFGDLTGRHARRNGQNAELLDRAPIRGDVVANGMTILQWRKQVVAFSDPTFPSGVWLISRADSELAPISPTGSVVEDIRKVKASLSGVSVLALPNTCLDPGLYDIEATGADVRLQPPSRKLNEMVPAILNNDAQATLLDVPDTLIALDRWPGQVKVVGPISAEQYMAAAFRPNSPQLREAFNAYLKQVRSDGTYNRLVGKYYPAVFRYFDNFFSKPSLE
jgi:ABC-type amino acid transport substrate-binding protein